MYQPLHSDLAYDRMEALRNEQARLCRQDQAAQRSQRRLGGVARLGEWLVQIGRLLQGSRRRVERAGR